MIEQLDSCPGCGVEPGTVHMIGCGIERCSSCGLRWNECGHARRTVHDPRFARWTGVLPGEDVAMQIYCKDRNLTFDRGPITANAEMRRVLFVKPKGGTP